MTYTMKCKWTGDTIAEDLSTEDIKTLQQECIWPDSLRIEPQGPLKCIRDVLGVEVYTDTTGNEFLAHPDGSLELITLP